MCEVQEVNKVVTASCSVNNRRVCHSMLMKVFGRSIG